MRRVLILTLALLSGGCSLNWDYPDATTGAGGAGADGGSGGQGGTDTAAGGRGGSGTGGQGGEPMDLGIEIVAPMNMATFSHSETVQFVAEVRGPFPDTGHVEWRHVQSDSTLGMGLEVSDVFNPGTQDIIVRITQNSDVLAFDEVRVLITD